jgi:hypothetical protein
MVRRQHRGVLTLDLFFGRICTCSKPLKCSVYSNVELPLWSFGSLTPLVITQLGDYHLVTRVQNYSLQK